MYSAKGNKNLLCETGEDCIILPNMGAYQGEDEFIDASSVASSTINCNNIPPSDDDEAVGDVTLYKFQTNGRN
jgi:hypothetical protein